MNGLTQGKIAFIVTSTLLILQLATLLAIYYLIAPFPLLVFFIPLIDSVLVFFMILGLVEKFIMRKIKILYRIVSSIGTQNIPRDLKDPELFEKLRVQVENYSIQKKEEVAKLKLNEDFRKEFVGNISHELKTPLFSIQGFAEILLDEVEDASLQKKYLQKIANNTNRLIEIVEDLTLISQAEGNQLTLHQSKFRIYELVLEVVESLEVFSKKRKQQVLIKDPEFIHYMVIADRAKLFQVFLNLIENAIFYTPEKSTIEIRFFDFETNVLIEISDNGMGISEDHLPRLFERFYRVDRDRSRAKGGSGLGLSIVKKILEAHGQSIQVHSKINKGTTFSFTLNKP